MTDAIILSGAVAKGAFAAGALAVLLDPRTAPSGLDVRRIVGASSGALTGAYLAASIRRGDVANAGAALRTLWLNEADALKTFVPSVRGIATLEGFSTSAKLRALLQREIRPAPGTAAIELRLVVTTAAGEVRPGAHPPATTYEHVASFDGAAFDDAVQLEELFDTVLASGAFPGVFLPHAVTIDGARVLCVDGGLTNNAPLKHALDDPHVNRVFVISSYPRVAEPHQGDGNGAGMVAHLAEILVNERLYRDVREARDVNRALAELEANVTSPALLRLILGALGWSGRRQIEIVEIRPAGPLEGNAFAGLFSRALREEYVRAGEVAARVALAERGPVAAEKRPAT